MNIVQEIFVGFYICLHVVSWREIKAFLNVPNSVFVDVRVLSNTSIYYNFNKVELLLKT